MNGSFCLRNSSDIIIAYTLVVGQARGGMQVLFVWVLLVTARHGTIGALILDKMRIYHPQISNQLQCQLISKGGSA